MNLQIPQSMQAKNKDEDDSSDKQQEASNDVQESKNSPLSPNTRWNDALSSGGLQRMTSEQLQNKNDAKSRWQRTGFYAERITGTDGRQKKGVEDGDKQGAGESAGAKAAAIAPNKQMWVFFLFT